jgi:hypothetical protein
MPGVLRPVGELVDVTDDGETRAGEDNVAADAADRVIAHAVGVVVAW